MYRNLTILQVWERWLSEKYGKVPSARVLSKALLLEHEAWLLESGLHGRPRKPATVRKHLSVLMTLWEWAANDDVWGELVPRPRRIEVPRIGQDQAVAPTWAEMDAAIRACHGAQRALAILLRFTGLRVQQAMQLRWKDLDLERGTLAVRGELGKSAAERDGRIVPISPHLVAELKTWTRDGEYLLPSNRAETGPRARKARARDLAHAWARAGVREDVYRQRPHHAFRKGFCTELALAGAPAEAVEHLVGHSRGIRGHYVDPRALHLVEAVALIPPMHGETP